MGVGSLGAAPREFCCLLLPSPLHTASDANGQLLGAELHPPISPPVPPADIGEDAFGRRLGRNTVNLFVRFIDVALPSVMHVGGTRFLQVRCTPAACMVEQAAAGCAA